MKYAWRKGCWRDKLSVRQSREEIQQFNGRASIKKFLLFPPAERCGKRRFLTQADAFLHKLIDYSPRPLELFISSLRSFEGYRVFLPGGRGGGGGGGGRGKSSI